MQLVKPSSRTSATLRSWSLAARWAAAAAATVLVLAACAQSPTPSITVTLDSAAAELLRGGEPVEVQVTLARAGGASDDVELSISGLPAGVDATLDPETLSGGTLSSTLTLQADGSAADGDYDVTVTGTSGTLSDSAGLSLDVVSLSVSGRVLGILEAPMVGVAVRSQGDTAVTDANGSFTLTGLSVPYDLAVWSVVDEWVQIFEGMTGEEPVVIPVAGAVLAGTPRTAAITGDLSGGVIPVAADQLVVVCVEGVDGATLGCDTVAPTETAYSVNAQWFGAASRQARVHALQFEQDADDYPVAYQGYGNTEVTLNDGDAATADIDLGSALTTTAVDLTVSSVLPLSNTIAAVRVTSGIAMLVMAQAGTDTTHEVLMPVIDGATYEFAAISTQAIGWQADVTGPTATVTVPARPQQIAPVDLATDVTMATNFSATNPAGGSLTFIWSADSSDLIISLTSMSEQTTIPDPSEFGLALPANAAFGWQVLSHSGQSTDEGATLLDDYYRFLMTSSGSSQGFDGTGMFSIGETYEFTTAP